MIFFHKFFFFFFPHTAPFLESSFSMPMELNSLPRSCSKPLEAFSMIIDIFELTSTSIFGWVHWEVSDKLRGSHGQASEYLMVPAHIQHMDWNSMKSSLFPRIGNKLPTTSPALWCPGFCMLPSYVIQHALADHPGLNQSLVIKDLIF